MRRLICLAALLLCLTFAACSQGNEAPPPLLRPESTRMDTAQVDRGPVVEVSQHTGITRYRAEAVYFENPIGTFDTFYVNPGDTVVEGQLLASLDTESLEAQITRQTERIAAMEADNTLANNIRQAAIDIMAFENERNIAAGAEGALSETLALEWARMELRQQRERQAVVLRHEGEQLEALQARMRFTELRAPFDGIITNISDIGQGQFLRTGQPIMYVSNRQETVIEIVSLTEVSFPSTGGARGWRPMVVRDAILTQAHINGQVYDMEFVVTPLEMRHFRPVELKTLTGEHLPAGLYFPVYFYTVNVQDALRIPSNALFTTPGYFFVNKVENGELIQTEVRVLAGSTTMLAIEGDLEVGDEIFVRP